MLCLGIVMLYYFVGVFGAFLYYGIVALLVGAVLMMVGYAIRYLLYLATCGYCKVLAIPVGEQSKVLVPFPKSENHRKTIGKPSETHWKTRGIPKEAIGKPLENNTKTIREP